MEMSRTFLSLLNTCCVVRNVFRVIVSKMAALEHVFQRIAYNRSTHSSFGACPVADEPDRSVQAPQASAYVIDTSTVSGVLNVPYVDVRFLYRFTDLKQFPSMISIQYMSYPTRTQYPIKTKKNKKSKGGFKHQTSIVVMVEQRAIDVKLFCNGKVNVVGALHHQQAVRAVQYVIEIIQNTSRLIRRPVFELSISGEVKPVTMSNKAQRSLRKQKQDEDDEIWARVTPSDTRGTNVDSEDPQNSEDPKPEAESRDPEPKAESQDPEPEAKSRDPEPEAESQDPEPEAESQDPENSENSNDFQDRGYSMSTMKGVTRMQEMMFLEQSVGEKAVRWVEMPQYAICTHDPSVLGKIEIVQLDTTNIHCVFDCRVHIDRYKLFYIMTGQDARFKDLDKEFHVTFDPQKFPGVKWKNAMERGTAFVFQQGKVVMTGVKSLEALDRLYQRIRNLLSTLYHDIKLQ
jgi:TATA-box binding protein (TBP) (component of TFIID and TFIIIB)